MPQFRQCRPDFAASSLDVLETTWHDVGFLQRRFGAADDLSLGWTTVLPANSTVAAIGCGGYQPCWLAVPTREQTAEGQGWVAEQGIEQPALHA